MFNLRNQITGSMNLKVHVPVLILGCFATLGLNGCDSGSTGSAGSGGDSPSVKKVIIESEALSINSMGETRLFESKSTQATIALKGVIMTNVDVSILSNESSVLNVSPNSCTLNTDNRTCSITLIGESLGTADFSIKANGYPEVTSESYIVVKQTSESLSSTKPYSRSHAGVQTPVQVIFTDPVNKSTINSNTFYVTDSSGVHIPGVIETESKSATLTFTSPLSYGKTYTVNVTNGVKDVKNDSVAALNESFTTQTPYRVFVSDTTTTGDLSGIDGAGIDGADTVCSDDPGCAPIGGSCKAILATTSTAKVTRQATPRNNWVLEPYTAYDDGAGTLIGTTGADSLFTFPLNHSIGDIFMNVWTGINSDWDTAENNCSDWTSDADNIFGNTGNPAAFDNQVLYMGETLGKEPCDASRHLYCVQVPH